MPVSGWWAPGWAACLGAGWKPWAFAGEGKVVIPMPNQSIDAPSRGGRWAVSRRRTATRSRLGHKGLLGFAWRLPPTCAGMLHSCCFGYENAMAYTNCPLDAACGTKMACKPRPAGSCIKKDCKQLVTVQTTVFCRLPGASLGCLRPPVFSPRRFRFCLAPCAQSAFCWQPPANP